MLDKINSLNLLEDTAIKDGIGRLKKANKFYAEGMDIIDSGINNSLKAKIDNGFIADMASVVNTMVKPNQPGLIRNFIRAITPSAQVEDALLKIRESSRPTLLEDAAKLFEEGRITDGNVKLDEAGTLVKSQLEKSFISDKGMYFGAWYKSIYASSDPFSGYGAWILPGLEYEIALKSSERLKEWDTRYSESINSLESKMKNLIQEIN